MGLITFFLLGAFSLLYVSKTWEGKPEFVSKAVGFINQNIDMIAIAGVLFGLIAAIVTPLRVHGLGDLLIHLLANVMLFVMALPYAFDRLAEKFGGKINEAVMGELRNVVGFISAREKIAGYAGAVLTVLVFAIVFR